MSGGATRRPTSTYRLQIHAGFDLFEAARRLPYLHDLGVDWVYLSPLLAAEPGSTHGYDVVAFDHVDESRGGAEGLAAVSTEARRLGMGVLVDLVPNHVGVATPAENAWWWDVLTYGQTSIHAEAFDIDWDFGLGKVLLPVLGDDDLPVDGGPIGNLTVADGEFRYHDHRFPLSPGTIWTGAPDENDVTAVHARQHYELIGWRRGDSDLNYRRFFTVTSLAGVRVELPEVFSSTHVEVRRWFDEGLVDGLRIDHPDGLRDPGGYLGQLAELTGNAYVLVEKILEPGEDLPRSWATSGTTGYDALALVDRVLTDQSGEAAFDALESRLRGGPMDWEALVHDRKRDVADHSLRAETRRIVRELPDLLPESIDRLEDAVAELLTCFPVYRSYLPLGGEHLDAALAGARAQRPDLVDVLDVLEPVLTDPENAAALRFQQSSGMVMAKGVEDCAFYRYARLTSLNEVGADPSIWAITPEEWHRAMVTRQRDWPDAMTTLTTHDTKRSEDVRARISALAEAPDLWEQTLSVLLDAAPVPDPGFANLLWQTAYGAWPLSRERLHAYAEKAMREGGDHTTWTDPDEAYESAVHSAVDSAYDDERVGSALDALDAELAPAGRSNALAAKLLSITIPGVPDVYQGSEIEALSLVDPDNRRPVDFDAAAASLVDGSVAKQQVTAAALRLRRDRPELFTSYTPLLADGPAADHVLAFDRGGVITVVTRLPVGLEQTGWGGTTITLPEGGWRSALAGFPGDQPTPPLHTQGNVCEEADSLHHLGNRVPLADLLAHLPIALLVRED